MNAKRVAILLLIFSLIVTVILPGCGKKQEQKSVETTEQEATKDSSGAAPEREIIGNMYKTGLPIVKDKITLKIASFTGEFHKDKFEGIEMVKRWEDETNIHIEWDTVPSASWQERKNLIIASGDLPDCIVGNIALTDDEVQSYGEKGISIPLEKLIDEWAPNLKAILQQHPEYKQIITTLDGHIYAFPALADIDFGSRGSVLHMNKKWLEEIGISRPIIKGKYVEIWQEPITTEEFYQILKKFKENHPKCYPFSFPKNQLYDMFASFGLQDNGDHIILENDKVVFTADKQEYKEAVKYFHTLYKEELMDPEVFTHEYNVFLSKMKQDPYIFGAVKVWTAQQAYELSDPRFKDWILIPPLKGPNGNIEWPKSSKWMARGFAIITSANKYPEISTRFFDYFYSERNSVDIMIGPLGHAAKENPDGTYEMIPVPEGKTWGEWVGSKNPGNMPFITTPEINKRVKWAPEVAMTIEVGEFYKPYQKYKSYPNIMFRAEDKQKIADIKANMHEYINAKTAEWIVKGNIEKEWNDYIEELNKMGLKEFIKIYQDSYDMIKEALQ